MQEVEGTHSVEEVKAMITELEGIPASEQLLLCGDDLESGGGGMRMEAGMLMEDYRIHKESVVAPPRAGSGPEAPRGAAGDAQGNGGARRDAVQPVTALGGAASG